MGVWEERLLQLLEHNESKSTQLYQLQSTGGVGTLDGIYMRRATRSDQELSAYLRVGILEAIFLVGLKGRHLSISHRSVWVSEDG